VLPLTGDRRAFLSWGVLLAIGLLVQAIIPETLMVFVGLAFWWIIIGAALTLTGFWEKMRLMTYYGLLVIITGLIFEVSPLPYRFTLLGFGLIVGVGLGLVGWVTDRAVVPIGAYMLFGSALQYVAPPNLYPFLNVFWLMLGGAAFASFGFIKRTAFAHFTGMAFIFGLATVFVLGGNYVLVGLVGFVIIGGALLVSFFYMFQTLGRTPHVEEILTLAAKALFTYGLRKPLDQYRVIAITIQGDIATELIINELLTKIEEKWHPIVLLGPTSPTQITLPRGLKLGWVTSLSGITTDYTVLSPGNPSDVNIFLGAAMKEVSNGHVPVLIGDFLDNMIPVMREDAFYKYYSELASRIKLLNSTAVFIIKSDIHAEVAVNIVKSFADVIIENREREERNKVVREVRVSNKVDNFQTDWQAVPRASPIAS
jgi:hypothetical protein